MTKGASTLLNLGYGYTASAGQMGAGTTAGNSSQMVSITGTVNGSTKNQAFTYDNVGRLLTAAGAGWQRRYAYDRWGNRTGMWDAVSGGSLLQSVAIATTGSVANNRISTVNGLGHTYNATGDVTNDGTHSYAYDGESRITSVDGGSTASSAYDSNNRRVKKVSGGNTIHYVWEGNQVIAEYNGGTGALISEYVYVGSRMLARDQGGVVKYYHQDKLSTRLITDSSGNMIGSEDHQPFGEEAGIAGDSEKHRFTDYERDSESGTDYAINRQYNQGIGRFMRPDPVSGILEVPQSWNRYSYTASDPVNSVDPLGLTTCYIDWMESPCSLAFSLLNSGAGVEYNGHSVTNIGGSLVPIRFDAQGNLIATIRVATNSPLSGTTGANDDEGNPTYVIGVSEKTINVRIPFSALPVGLKYAMGWNEPGIQTDWGAQLLIGSGIGAAIKGVAGLGASAAAEAGTEAAAEASSEATLTARLGDKLKYPLGEATGNLHNIERSVEMARQLNSIGVFNNAAGRQLLTDNLNAVLNNPASVIATQANGVVIRESLLIGPSGMLKMESYWEGAALRTVQLFGRGR